MLSFHHIKVVVRPILFGGWSVGVRYSQASEKAKPVITVFGNVIVLEGGFSSRRTSKQWAKKIKRIVSGFPKSHFRKSLTPAASQPELF